MKLRAFDIALFSMLGGLMYASKVLMQILPNIHLIGVFIIAITLVYRKRALLPLYIFVFLDGIFSGFSPWWVPNLYIWTILFCATMLLPRKLPEKTEPFIYMTLCAFHGLLFGLLWAPAHSLLMGLNFKATVAWIVVGLPFDAIHGISNFFCGALILPMVKVLKRFNN